MWPVAGLELRLVDGGIEAVAEMVGPVEFEANCVERWQDSLTARAYQPADDRRLGAGVGTFLGPLRLRRYGK